MSLEYNLCIYTPPDEFLDELHSKRDIQALLDKLQFPSKEEIQTGRCYDETTMFDTPCIYFTCEADEQTIRELLFGRLQDAHDLEFTEEDVANAQIEITLLAGKLLVEINTDTPRDDGSRDCLFTEYLFLHPEEEKHLESLFTSCYGISPQDMTYELMKSYNGYQLENSPPLHFSNMVLGDDTEIQLSKEDMKTILYRSRLNDMFSDGDNGEKAGYGNLDEVVEEHSDDFGALTIMQQEGDKELAMELHVQPEHGGFAVNYPLDIEWSNTVYSNSTTIVLREEEQDMLALMLCMYREKGITAPSEEDVQRAAQETSDIQRFYGFHKLNDEEQADAIKDMSVADILCCCKLMEKASALQRDESLFYSYQPYSYEEALKSCVQEHMRDNTGQPDKKCKSRPEMEKD